MKEWSPPEFCTKTCLTNNYFSCDPHFVILAWVQSWNIFEKLMKVCSPPEKLMKVCTLISKHAHRYAIFLRMFQDKCNRDCNRDYYQCNRNRLHLWFCLLVFVFEHVISNCNRLHLWCNRPTSGTKLNYFWKSHEWPPDFFNKTTFLQTLSLLYLAIEDINLSCCASILL